MPVHIAIGDKGCQRANELRAVAIIVDALRASATLSALMALGVEEVWVVAEVAEAWRLKREMPDALLVGERKSVKVPGFDFSNSPTEIWQAGDLTGRRAIFTSTTGARRILACRQAQAVLIGTTVNATAVAQAARRLAQRFNAPIVIVASGVYGEGDEWAQEDVAAAWVIAERLSLTVTEAPQLFPPEPQNFCDLKTVFAHTLHGRELLQLGLDDDVVWCAQVDIVSVVPQVVSFRPPAAVLRAGGFEEFTVMRSHYYGSP
ncbi:MAG: hypothetical protein C4295_03550 [Candidatus Fervidibacterota bacterium]